MTNQPHEAGVPARYPERYVILNGVECLVQVMSRWEQKPPRFIHVNSLDARRPGEWLCEQRMGAWMSADLRDVLAELDRSRRSAPAMEPVAVKPLEWGHDHTEREWHGNVVAGTGYNYLVKRDGRWCTGPDRRWVLEQSGDVEAAKKACQADYESRIRSALVAPPTPSGLDARTVEAAVVAGWNACRKSLYAVCEDIQEQADALRISAPVTTAAAEQHSKGYHAGSNFAAKSIARGFNSMEAMDDDNALAALRSLTQETTK